MGGGPAEIYEGKKEPWAGTASGRPLYLPCLFCTEGKTNLKSEISGGVQNPKYRGIGRGSHLLPDPCPLAVGRVCWNPEEATPATAVDNDLIPTEGHIYPP